MSASSPSETAITRIAICGSGLALWMAAAALSKGLPKGVSITAIETGSEALHDALYGTVMPPEFYGFHSELELSEPDLLQNTSSVFCFGTQVNNWTSAARTWVQPFHLPVSVWNGVAIDKIVQAVPGASLQDILISAAAARRGVFAHPPEDRAHPLSRAEYGYGVDIAEIAAMYKSVAARSGVTIAQGKLASVAVSGSGISAIELAPGGGTTVRIETDFVIDAGGPESALAAAMGQSRKPFGPVRRIAVQRTVSAGETGPALCTLTADGSGYCARTPLRESLVELRVGAAESAKPNATGFVVSLGRSGDAWHGNVVSIGTAAGILEPLSCAPLRGLLGDIRRVLSLVPVGSDMRIEARHYNRAQADDFDHAMLFGDAHYVGLSFPDHSFWNSAPGQTDGIAPSRELERKLDLFGARGYLVAYDHEPFDSLDWAVLHDGVGRTVRRPDRLATTLDPVRAAEHLAERRARVDAVVAKMPPHPVYLSKLMGYLSRKFPAHA